MTALVKDHNEEESVGYSKDERDKEFLPHSSKSMSTTSTRHDALLVLQARPTLRVSALKMPHLEKRKNRPG